MVPSILQGDSPGDYPFDEIPVLSLVFEKFSSSSEIHFLIFFFYLHMFDDSTSNIPKYL